MRGAGTAWALACCWLRCAALAPSDVIDVDNATDDVEATTVTATTTTTTTTFTASATTRTTTTSSAEGVGINTTTVSTTSTRTTSTTTTSSLSVLFGVVELRVADTSWFFTGEPAVREALAAGVAAAFGAPAEAVLITGLRPVAGRRLRRLRARAEGRAARRLAAGKVRVEFQVAGLALSAAERAAADALVGARVREALAAVGADVVIQCIDACAGGGCAPQACEADGAAAPPALLTASEPRSSLVYQVERFLDEWLVPWGIIVIGLLALALSACCGWCWMRRRRRKKAFQFQAPRLEDPPLFPGRQERSPAVGELQAVSPRPSDSSSFGEDSMFGGGPHRAQGRKSAAESSTREGAGAAAVKDGGGLRAPPFFGGARESREVGSVLAASPGDGDNRRLEVQEQLEGPGWGPPPPGAEGPEIPRGALTKWVKMVYARYNPSKLDRVDRLVAEYQGRERALVEAISEKYQLHPSHFERHYARSMQPSLACGACVPEYVVCGDVCGAGAGFSGVLPEPPKADLLQLQLLAPTSPPAQPSVGPPTWSKREPLPTNCLR